MEALIVRHVADRIASSIYILRAWWEESSFPLALVGIHSCVFALSSLSACLLLDVLCWRAIVSVRDLCSLDAWEHGWGSSCSVCKAALGVVRVEGVLWLHGWHSFLFSWGSSCVALHMGGIPFPPSRRLDYPIPYMHAWLEACVVRMGAPHDDTFTLWKVEREIMCYKW